MFLSTGVLLMTVIEAERAADPAHEHKRGVRSRGCCGLPWPLRAKPVDWAFVVGASLRRSTF